MTLKLIAAAVAEAGPEPEVVIEATYGWYWIVDWLREQDANVHYSFRNAKLCGRRSVARMSLALRARSGQYACVSERLAQCGCGRVQVRVHGEPQRIYVCHCDFCQKRSGTPGTVNAWFDSDQVLEIQGDTTTYNGLETDGVGVAELGFAVSY